MVDILLVDDAPDRRVAIEAMLEGLGGSIVAASSAWEAMKHVLRRPFGVILLDVDMPGVDGFETAALIRQYRPSRHTPILFITANEDVLMSKTSSLVAVDYVVTPIVPAVLRRKVGAFAGLFDETVCGQGAAIAQHAARLTRLVAASSTIHSLASLEGIVQAITDAARDLVDAHQATTTLDLPSICARAAVSLSDEYAAFRGRSPARDDDALGVRERRACIRLAHGETVEGPPRRGLLATVLTDHDGRAMGIIQVTDKREGDFLDGDEAILVQLAHLGSIAIRNCLQADRREATRMKDEFLATLSHELRTPLTAVLGWAHLLRKGPLTPERLGRGLEVIERSVNHQAAMIEELFDASRIVAGKLLIDVRPLALGPIVEGAVAASRPAAEAKGIRLEANLGDGGERVLGNAERLSRVVGNLVRNAVKFTPRHGRVDIVLRREGGDAELVVADTGVGVPADFLPFVFDGFRQADGSRTRAHGGLGLGLAVVRQLVELHGGSVRVQSPGAGHGATFVVRFPDLAPSSPAPADATAVRAAEAAATPIRSPPPGCP